MTDRGRKASRERTDNVQRRTDSVLDAIDGAISSPYSDAMRWSPPEQDGDHHLNDDFDHTEVTPTREDDDSFPSQYARYLDLRDGPGTSFSAGHLYAENMRAFMGEIYGQPEAWPEGQAEWFRPGDVIDSAPAWPGTVRVVHVEQIEAWSLSPEALGRIRRSAEQVGAAMRRLVVITEQAATQLGVALRRLADSHAGELLGKPPADARRYGPRDRLPKGSTLSSGSVGPTPSGRPPHTLGRPDTHGHGGRNRHRRRH